MEKIAVWGDRIPGNSPESKFPDMKINRNAGKLMTYLRFFFALSRKRYKDCRSAYDTFTYRTCIKRGTDKETYGDVPYLVPFSVEGSDRAVIVVPGGGFCFKSTDTDGEGNQSEGDLIAKALNEAGVSAFVLWYRSNPYRMPVEAMDLQRAVRYVRYHAEEYGIDPGKIGAIGFSAGGFLIAEHINITGGTDLFPEDYVPDEVDLTDDALNNAAPIYPCLTLKYNETLVYPLFGTETANDPVRRKEAVDRTDCILHCRSAHVPQFISYGTKDPLVAPAMQEAYVSALREKGGDVVSLPLKGAGHGYGACAENNQQYRWWVDEYLKWVNEQFSRSEV